MNVPSAKLRARSALIAVVVILVGGAGGVGALWCARGTNSEEGHSVSPTKTGSTGSAGVATAHATPSQIPDSEKHPHLGELATSESIGSGGVYPVSLDALRARLPDNRYWALGAPTSDPAVAKVRAARAEQDNAALGRIQANEASPEEVRAYYAERRALSSDYLQIAELVLTENGDRLPERDRGMFELTVTLHRARLQQIDRDESDALARLTARGTSAGAR